MTATVGSSFSDPGNHPTPATLTDARADADLRSSGAAVIEVFPPDVIDAVRAAYDTITPEGDHGLTVDYMRPDRTVMRRITAEVLPLVAPHLAAAFTDHRPVMATFVTKHPGPLSEMFLHEDRTFVDERRHRAATAWIPLVDVGPDLHNGGLQIVPRSHLLPLGLSGSNTPDTIRPYEAHLRSLLEPLTVPAGSAAVYDTRVLHASPANLGATPRVALVIAMAPRPAPLVHVVGTGRRGRAVHRVDEAFFVEHHPRDIEQAMPEQYPVIAEVADDGPLLPEHFTVLGGPVPDHPEVVVPGDVGAASGTSATVVGRVPFDRVPFDLPDDHDLTVTHLVVDVPRLPSPELTVTASTGTTVLRAVGGLVRTDTSPHALWSRASDTAAWLVALEPGSRLTVGGTSSTSYCSVLEAPTVGAGLSAGDRLGTAVPGWRSTVPSGAELTLWNDGPGELIAVVSVDAVPEPPRSRRRAVADAILHRLPRRRSDHPG